MNEFGNNNLDENIIPKDNSSESLYFKKSIFFLIIVIVWVVIVIVDLSIVFTIEEKEESDNHKPTEIYQINCFHEVKEDSTTIQLLSKSFQTKEKIQIFVNETLANDIWEFKVEKAGKYFVKIELRESNIDNIFKDIQTLISVEFSSGQ